MKFQVNFKVPNPDFMKLLKHNYGRAETCDLQVERVYHLRAGEGTLQGSSGGRMGPFPRATRQATHRFLWDVRTTIDA